MKMKRLIAELILVLVLAGGLVLADFGGSGEFGKLKLTFQKLKWNIFPKTSGGIDVGSATKKIGAVHVIDLYADHIAGDTIVETVTGGVNITNSGTSKNPILDLDENIGVDSVVERTVGAGVTIEEVRLEDGEVQAGAWKATVVADEYGGTGHTTYAKGDLLHASLADTLSKLGIGSDNQVLVVATDLPNWEPLSSDLLSDVASIGMLNEAEIMLAKWNFSSYQMTDADVEDTMTVIAVADIEMGGTYQVVGLQAPAANGEAIRQTAKIDETKLESLYDNRITSITGPLDLATQTLSMTNVDNSSTDGYLTWEQYLVLDLVSDKVNADSEAWADAYDKQVDTWTAPLDWTTKTASISNVNNTDTDGYLTHEQFAILEDKYTQTEADALLDDKLAIADSPIISDIAYNDTSWNTNTDAASKNAIRDKINTMNIAIDLNTAKSTNVSTSLSVGTVGENTVAITSDGGADDVTLPAATVATAGMFTKAKWDEVVANNAKVTNATHTGAVTGSGELTITAKAVTYAKIQDTSGTDKLIGRSTAGGGVVEEIACTSAGRDLLDDADTDAQRTTLGKVPASAETNLQAIMHGNVTVTTTNYDGTATITYGNTFTANPTVVAVVAETLYAGYDSIINIEDVGMDTCIVRLIDCVDNDSSITVNYIVMGDE